MNYVERMQAACKIARTLDVWPPFAGPATDGDIRRAEQLLGLKLSGSYRTFVRLLGQQNDFGFCGVDKAYGDEAGAVWETRVLREKHELPQYYLVVGLNENADEALVLDTRIETAPGEHPVYAMVLPGWRKSIQKVNDSFVEFFEWAMNIQPSKKPSKVATAKQQQKKSAKRAKLKRTKTKRTSAPGKRRTKSTKKAAKPRGR
jgi:hypothetical protein